MEASEREPAYPPSTGGASRIAALSFVRWPLFRRFSGLTLTWRFALVSFVILLTGMLIIGWWVTRQIEQGVLNRTASVTASFVSSSVAPLLVDLSEGDEITFDRMNDLDVLLTETELGRRVVSFKVWSPSGEILYSPDREMVGRTFVVSDHLALALEGRTVSEISDLSEPENEFERSRYSRLLEIYTPLRSPGSDRITGAVEFYEETAILEDELADSKFRSWLIVVGATVLMYMLLVGMVGHASRTISWQRRELAHAEAQNELDRMKEEFVSGISHELRTPLGLIRGYSTTLLRRNVEFSSETGQEFLHIIADESANLERMIEDLLDTSRIQAGTLAISPAAVRLRDLLDGALERARPALGERGHSVTIKHAAEDPEVMADRGRVEQVIYNLLDNSARYSAPDTPINVTVVLRTDEALVEVADRGAGIPASELERVFEPFWRGRSAVASQARGTGLGLAVSRAIVEAQGGRIWAESGPGRGTRVRFTLPLAKSSPIPDDSEPA